MPSGVQVSPWLHPGLCPFLPLCADAAHASLLPVHSCLLQPPLQASGFSHLSAPISASMPPLAFCLPLSLFFSGLCVIPPPHRPRCRGRQPRWAGYQLSPLPQDPDLGGGHRGSTRAMGLLAWVWPEGAWEGGLSPLSPTGPSLSPATTFLPSLLPPPSPSPVYTPQIRTGCYHGS